MVRTRKMARDEDHSRAEQCANADKGTTSDEGLGQQSESIDLPATSSDASASEESLSKQLPVTPKKSLKRSRTSQAQSPYFTPVQTPKRSSAKTAIGTHFPPLSQKKFGLVQEQLADEPFQLLVAVLFLNRTKASNALPVFWNLMERYPTPLALSNAAFQDVLESVRHLGLQNQRAKKIISLAKAWHAQPPQKGSRYRTLHYPYPGAGSDIKPDEILDDADERIGAWEIAHLTGAGVGDYALDSWRMFCRDKLRGLDPCLGPQTQIVARTDQGSQGDLEPEWRRVVPRDKELRAYLRWAWLRQGWEWDPLTGRRRRATEELLEQAEAGNVIWAEREWSDGGSDADV